jgi:hypothetical protein
MMQHHRGATLADVQLALATLAEAFATALERSHPGVAADVHSLLQERIEHLENTEKHHARVMLLAAASGLANIAAKSRSGDQD